MLLNVIRHVTDGFVSLIRSADKEPVKILQDTGNLCFRVCSVLIGGIGLNVLSVPLNKIFLQSDFNLG